LSLEDEARIVAQEKETLEQQAGQQASFSSPGDGIYLSLLSKMMAPSMYPPAPSKPLVPPGF
jgi:hypothetical protein